MDGGWVQSAPSVGLKRKSMSLNADGGTTYVGVDNFRWDSVTAISREEKKELRKRLKLQLEQVEGLSLRISARQEQLLLKGPDRGVRTSHSDAHLSRTDNGGLVGKDVTSEPAAPPVETPRALSQREARLARQPSVIVSSDRLPGTPGIAGKEKRTPKANQLYLNSEFVSGKDKMPPPEKVKPKAGVGSKRGAPGKVDARDAKRAKVETARSKRMSDIMKQCGTLLKKLISHKHAWVFNEPVDAVKLGLHDYHKVIKKPMDLGTIKKKLDAGHYTSPLNFAEDIRLTFANAMTYNPTGHDVYVMAEVLRELFEERWKNIEEKVDEDRLKMEVEEEALAAEGQGKSESYNDLKQHLRSIEDQIQSLSKTARPPGGRPPAQPKPKPDDVEKRPMTFDEKRKLSVALENVPPDKLERIVEIIKERNLNVSHNEDEIEVDIDSFDNDTLWKLDRFVTNCAKSRGKVKKKAPQKDLQPRPEHDGAQLPGNGIGEAVKKTRKGGEAEEEDVDIDDDMAPAQCQPVVIEKDAGASSSSSSSSSDSGSSSSDSDSASSSGSDSEPEEVQNVEVFRKGSPAVAEPEVPKTSEAPEEYVAETVEEPAPSKPTSTGRQDESREEGLPERQVSPEKLLRAALLKGRFADTILKAQEKTLPFNKNEKLDPEKQKRDREELEKRQKEEKARLHAEAKAAEVVRRRAEAEAAAEAKRRRDAERAAARIELQQMEKTVEIDENSEVLKDLEMLRSKVVESSGDDASPDADTPGDMTMFALQGGNPLHQLGLFIKEDDEDDENHES